MILHNNNLENNNTK